MIEVFGDIFSNSVLSRADAICITTNGKIKTNGRAVMGAGVAKVARDKFKGIDEDLANNINMNGNITQLIRYYKHFNEKVQLVALPTKNHYVEDSSLELIVKSINELVVLTDKYKWEKVFLPRPGCSNGKLNWVDVRMLIKTYLDDRFYVITNGE